MLTKMVTVDSLLRNLRSSTGNKAKQWVRVGKVRRGWSRGSHNVCTVPGVLSAIASDICYLLKTSGFTIRSWENRKNQSPSWRGVRGQRLQSGLPSRNTHRLTSMHFVSFWKELMSCFYLHQKHPTLRKAFFFYSRVPTEASPLLTCGTSWDWRGSFPALCRGSLWCLPTLIML